MIVRRCAVCDQTCLDLYMVKDEVWPFREDEVCHLRCLEQKINRPLTIFDFIDKPINEGIKFGYEMGNGQTR